MLRIRVTRFSLPPMLILLLGLCAASFANAATSVLDDIKVDFELVNRDGDLVRYSDFRGRNVLLAFGFTHCQHICPMIAANMARALRVTDKDAVGIFVSVDTERDTPRIVDDYARGYSEMMIGLGGNFEQVSNAVNNFNATYVVTKSEDNYTVQHTPSIFLIAPDGSVSDVFAMTASPDEIVAAMR